LPWWLDARPGDVLRRVDKEQGHRLWDGFIAACVTGFVIEPLPHDP
jgi:hypothetical protein